jgi:antitoxin HigA-1
MKMIRRTPTHLGAILREDVIPALGIDVSDMALYLQITPQQLQSILDEHTGISLDVAVRLGELCGNGPYLWLALQHAYGRWHADKMDEEDFKPK